MQKQPKTKLRKNGGFTLIEMLIVVAIIAILIAISLPMINSALERARNATDAANVRAAKAAALLDRTTGSVIKNKAPDASGNKVVYYDAVTGELSPTNPAKGYGKSTKDPDGADGTIDDGASGVPKGKDIEITIEPNQNITFKWV